MPEKTKAVFVVLYYDCRNNVERLLKAFTRELKALEFKKSTNLEYRSDAVYIKKVELVE